jgi:hypothetical protein
MGFAVVIAAVASASPLSAQTQAVMPGGMEQFNDGNGAPYAGGKVYMYVPYTTTPKVTYQDPYGTASNQNPIALDANGRAIIWGNGVYRQVLQDLNGVEVWDQLTYASPATAGGSGTGTLWYGTAVGTANAITLTGPTGFAAGDGQSVGFIANVTNTGATTINASGFGSVVVEKNTIQGLAVLSGSEIVAGNLEYATYSASVNAFILTTWPPNQAFGAQVSLASAATADLGTVLSRNVSVYGTTTITSFGSSASMLSPVYLVQFTGALTITESTALLTPNLQSIVTATGDSALVIYLGSGNWQIVAYFPATPAPQFVQPPQFRLTTTSGNPISPASATGVNTVYETPYNGNLIPLWNGTAFIPTACAEMSNVLANSSSGNAGPAAAVAASVYDLVAWNNAGTCTLTRDVAWSTVTAPAAGDAFARVRGILVNSVSIANGPAAGYGTFLGTITTDAGGVTVTFNPTPAAASAGPTNGAWVGLWNYYNRVTVGATAQDSKTSWSDGGTGSWETADASVKNRITYVAGVAEDGVVASYLDAGGVSVSSSISMVGVGVDSATVQSAAAALPVGASGGGNGSATATYLGVAAIGQHYFQALEYAASAATFYGTNASAQIMQLSAQLKY